MVSLKMTPAEAKAEGFGKPEDVKPPEYPWGTRLSLTDEAAKKLFPKLPEVGKSVAITGAAEVVSINITQQQGRARPDLHRSPGDRYRRHAGGGQEVGRRHDLRRAKGIA